MEVERGQKEIFMNNITQISDQSLVKSDETKSDISAKEFLDVIFGDIEEGEHVCVSRATFKKDKSDRGWSNYLESARQWRKWKPDDQAQAWYFNVSTVNGELNEKGTMVSRGRLNLLRYHVLVLDDIGQKTAAPSVEPTYKLESSAGSFQWGYALVPGSDLDRFEALIEAIHQKGWGDKGAGGSYRVMRVPGSANLKPGRQNFRSVITEWEPDRYWTLDELAAAFEVDLSKVEIKQTTIDTKSGGAQAMDGIDPMLDWLVDAGHVVQDKGEWVDVVCPWHESHTSGSNTGGYSPLGRGKGDWVQTRAYKCLHEHCRERNLDQFVKWAEKLGGPYVSGYDPLPWLQERYTYVGMDMKVADMHQRIRGGEWLWELSAWSKRNPGKIAVPGEKNKIKVADAFVASNKTRHVDYITYRPVAPADDLGIISIIGQQALNRYVPPSHVETQDEPEVFLRHIEYLIPKTNEREIFYNWLAHKIQYPDLRSYAVIMVAEDTFGVGRSWLKKMLGRVLQGHVNGATLGQLIGKGTSAEQNYNDWMACCQFLVVEEAKDSSITKDDFYHGYETFKQIVDTSVAENVRINPKFGRTRHENIYFNAMIFSNHADAMALPEGCRRTFVVSNPTEKLSLEYYDRLSDALTSDEPARVYWWLTQRDVSSFDRIYPPMTDAKAAMIENTRAPSDTIVDWIKDNYEPDIVTRESLRGAIILAAREHDFEKIMRDPSGIVKMIWRKLKTLRPEDRKHGARHIIDGKRYEFRAIRNVDKWKTIDAERDSQAFLDELNKQK